MPEQNTYDIAVIGGGLAGLCMALQAAEAGYNVVLFEKEQYPFHKVCGEYISLESRPFLERLGVPLTEWQVPIVDRLETTDVKGRTYNFKLPLGGFGISRYKLDDFLYRLAIAKGVTIKCETKVHDVVNEGEQFTIRANEGVYQSRVVTGSFGKRSNLDVKWQRPFINAKENRLSNYIGVKYHIKYVHDKRTIALHNFSDGYCGMSAIEDGQSCLCYLTTAENLRKSGNSISTMEKQILSANPVLEKIFKEGQFVYDKPLTISQVSFANKSLVQDGVLLLGDAAGMIPPLCGNGMSMAMHSSKLAFECIQSFIEKRSTRSEMEAGYKAKWKDAFASRLWVGRRVQQLFGGNQTTSLFLKTMGAMPAMAKQLIAATHGKPF